MRRLALILAAVIGALMALIGLMVPLCCARPCPEGVTCYPPEWINAAMFFGGIAIVVASIVALAWRAARRPR